MCFIWAQAVFESLRDENRQGIDGNSTERKEAGLLRPTKSRLGSNIAVLGLKLGQTGAHLGPTWAQLAPNSGPNLSPTGVQYGATWARHAWGHLAPKLGPRHAQCGQHGLARTHQSQKTLEIAVKKEVFRTWPGAQVGAKWPCWAQLAIQMDPN